MTLRDYIVSRKQGGRGLASVEVSIQRLEDYIEKRGEWLITATRNNSDDTRINRTETTRKQKNGEKNNWKDVLSD